MDEGVGDGEACSTMDPPKSVWVLIEALFCSPSQDFYIIGVQALCNVTLEDSEECGPDGRSDSLSMPYLMRSASQRDANVEFNRVLLKLGTIW